MFQLQWAIIRSKKISYGSHADMFTLGPINDKIFLQIQTGLLWLEWQHVSTQLGHHQAFTMNQLTVKLHTFLGSQTVFTSNDLLLINVSNNLLLINFFWDWDPKQWLYVINYYLQTLLGSQTMFICNALLLVNIVGIANNVYM